MRQHVATMQTKLSTVLAALDRGDIARAIAIAAKFPQLGTQRAAILDAHTAITNPRWAAAMKRDAAADIEAGRLALIERYRVGQSRADVPDQGPVGGA